MSPNGLKFVQKVWCYVEMSVKCRYKNGHDTPSPTIPQFSQELEPQLAESFVRPKQFYILAEEHNSDIRKDLIWNSGLMD